MSCMVLNHRFHVLMQLHSSMILPTGAYKPSLDPTKNLNKLDARVLGMPTSTMSTITISGSGGSNLGRRTSLGGLSRTPRATTPAHLLADLPPPVSYSAHHAPPTKITTSQVLVQVYAVALDRYDFDMVREKSDAGSGSGKWIPGRSFVGRALEVGAEVRAIAKGDMVVGLVDIKKVRLIPHDLICLKLTLIAISERNACRIHHGGQATNSSHALRHAPESRTTSLSAFTRSNGSSSV